jgi:hypothetical protein
MRGMSEGPCPAPLSQDHCQATAGARTSRTVKAYRRCGCRHCRRTASPCSTQCRSRRDGLEGTHAKKRTWAAANSAWRGGAWGAAPSLECEGEEAEEVEAEEGDPASERPAAAAASAPPAVVASSLVSSLAAAVAVETAAVAAAEADSGWSSVTRVLRHLSSSPWLPAAAQTSADSSYTCRWEVTGS